VERKPLVFNLFEAKFHIVLLLWYYL